MKYLDKLGFSTALLCAVHCAILPLLLSIGMFKTVKLLDHPILEISVLLMASYFVYKSIYLELQKDKKFLSSFILAILGLSLIIMHFFLGKFGTPVVVFGGILLMIAHLSKYQKEKYLGSMNEKI